MNDYEYDQELDRQDARAEFRGERRKQVVQDAIDSMSDGEELGYVISYLESKGLHSEYVDWLRPIIEDEIDWDQVDDKD